MSSTPRRNSPIVTAAKYSGASLDAVFLKKAITPGFAFSFLRNSLMTSVSIRYTRRLGRILEAREVRIVPDVRDRCERFRQVSLAWPPQCACQDLPMLGFGTAAMFRRTMLERSHQRLIDAAHD